VTDDWRKVTVDTYNKSAKELAEYFRGIGPRTDDINKAFELAGNPYEPKVLEIGCGDGRDAREIVAHTPNYVGFDISEELIKLARQHVPDGKFEVADALSYPYPENTLDVVFAFASLLHLDKAEVATVLQKVHAALRPGGILFISLKLAPKYKEELKEDKYGTRMFYFYNPTIISRLAAGNYEVIDQGGGFITVGNTQWFEVALKKI
jgi:SAM-dependent methyltransferase